MDCNAGANLTTALAPWAALLFAWIQINAARKSSKESLAKQIFFQVLQMPINHPTIHNVERCRPDNGKFDEAYKAYMRALLFACEEILELSPNDRAWEKSVERNLIKHAAYLKRHYDSGRLPSAYAESLVSLVEEICYPGRKAARLQG